MTKDRLSALLSKQNLGSNFIMLDASDIVMDEAPGVNDELFWYHHGNTKDDYVSLMQKLNHLYDVMSQGTTIEDMLAWQNRGTELHDTAYSFFTRERAISVERLEDGKYHFGGDGRHRILMAQELGMVIPVRVSYDCFAKETNRRLPNGVEDLIRNDSRSDIDEYSLE